MQVCDITNISRGSFHDGPGIRTVVYFNNCSLRCKWCHNPETITKDNEILYIKSKCIHCGKCIEICPEHHKAVGDSMEFFREGCTKCGKCADACPAGALNISGESYTPERLMKEIRKDKHYFEESGGGVTFSGGECLLKPQFLREVLKMCKAENIHTCIDTSGITYNPGNDVYLKKLDELMKYTDLVMLDIKHIDSEKHQNFTGKSNENILLFAKYLEEKNINLWVRHVVVPGYTDNPEDLKNLGRFIGTLKNLHALDVLPYHTLGVEKYKKLGISYPLEGVSPLSQNDAIKAKTFIMEGLKEVRQKRC